MKSERIPRVGGQLRVAAGSLFVLWDITACLLLDFLHPCWNCHEMSGTYATHACAISFIACHRVKVHTPAESQTMTPPKAGKRIQQFFFESTHWDSFERRPWSAKTKLQRRVRCSMQCTSSEAGLPKVILSAQASSGKVAAAATVGSWSPAQAAA